MQYAKASGFRGVTCVALALCAMACGSGIVTNNGGTGGTGGTARCPDNVPQACPADAPQFQRDVAPIIAQACGSCHGPDGVEGSALPLQDYNDVFRKRVTVLGQVANCQMPQVDSGVTLDPNDRLTFMTWLVCNAPNN